MLIYSCGAFLSLILSFTIPQLDLADDQFRQVTIDRETNQYLGHPTTVLLEDGQTIFCVYPKGHGKGEETKGLAAAFPQPFVNATVNTFKNFIQL